MLSVKEAQEQILSHFNPLEKAYIPLDEAAGCVLAESVYADMDLPTFNNSSVDGFAVFAADVSPTTQEKPRSLKVVADIPAGNAANVMISPGQSARIMTGALLPTGADAVVMVEDTNFHQRAAGEAAPRDVTIYKAVRTGENVRKQGADIKRGQEILPATRILQPQDIGMLAMLGVAKVPVQRKPKVALLSSGDELLPVEAPLEAGKIHDSNTYMLEAMARKLGCEDLRLGVAADRYEVVSALLDKAADSQPDVIISSAGVSVGAFDYVKEAVESAGTLNFWKVDMRPGKPLTFGEYHGIPFFGLPGNPVSSFVSFLVFVQPALERMSGVEAAAKARVKVVLAEGVESDGRESYLRALVSRKEGGEYVAKLTGHQGSGNLFSLVQANALLIIPSGVKSCPPGSEVEAWLLES
jgi:molybdopterin molybdotransferase